MSTRIKVTSGRYRIRNYFFTDCYLRISENNEITVKVLEADLVTLFDATKELYIGFDLKEGKVKGCIPSQELHLITFDNGQSVIYLTDDWMCYIEDGDSCSIVVGSPPMGDAKYWVLDKVE